MLKRRLTRLRPTPRLTDHLLQGFVVFASVFLAFWLTDIRESRKTRHDVDTALRSIALEMDYNHDRIVSVYAYHTTLIHRIDSTARLSADSGRHLLAYTIPGWQGIQMPMLRSAAWTTFVGSGLVTQLPFSTQKALADIYTVQKIIEDADRNIINLTITDMEFVRLGRVRHLSGLYVQILPDVMGFYQKHGRPMLQAYGYARVPAGSALKTEIEQRFGRLP